jgi:hypothetical protein
MSGKDNRIISKPPLCIQTLMVNKIFKKIFFELKSFRHFFSENCKRRYTVMTAGIVNSSLCPNAQSLSSIPPSILLFQGYRFQNFTLASVLKELKDVFRK